MKLDEAKDAIMAVAVRGCEVYAGSVDGRVRCYDVRMGRATVDVVCTKGVTAVKPTRDGRGVLVAGLDAKVRVMDKATGRCLQTLKGHENSEFRVGCCWAEEESVVVSGSEEGGVWCWDVTTAEAKRVLRGHGTDGKGRKVVSCVDAKKGGGEIVSGGNDGDVIVWGV